ncbi:3-oxoacyl-ACP synthase [Algibacter mikhailovii]|uniref:3-oxoacyl-ACP synthase n=1 Tax=Algibacter mikhailovii TaxID=425498 RepID=A0A918QYI4_9FLAO|nr:3-oxoacyl-ACP synthase [Algibacter mikhailovii]GGZ75937.1 hypothetical protein GCM10007028_11860 [Algibacter mikhailovii]
MTEDLKIKEALMASCEHFVEDRLATIQVTINDIQTALTSETKSSAGDKHETGRAMLQLEREKAGNQMAEVQKIKEILSKIDIYKTIVKIGVGSVVYTSELNYFIGISAGKVHVANEPFYAVSASTPMGKLLMAHQVGDFIQFRNQNFKIIKVI